MAETEFRLYRFRGGPLDGRELPIPVTENREWSIPTVDGIWVGDRTESVPGDLSDVDYRHEKYLRVDDQYLHESLVTAEHNPPRSFTIGRPETGEFVRFLPAPDHDHDEIRLIAVELFEDEFVVRWEWTRPEEWAHPEDAPATNLLLTPTDNLGTEYFAAHIHENATATPSRCVTMFKPAVPPSAAWLEIAFAGTTVRFDL